MSSESSRSALIYLRISADRTGERAGVERQREDCERRARERGWPVIAVEVDNDISAAGKRKRPGFEAMLQAVEAGTVQVVIAWALDRLQRNRRDEVRLYEACQRRGVMLSLVNGTDLDFNSAAGRFVADSLGSVARLEIELKSDRQKRAALQAAQQGRRTGGRRPFGYDANGVTVRPDEAAAVAQGYRDFLAGVPLAEIARGWNRQGFTTGQTRRDGAVSPWRQYAVRMVLANPRYMGKRSHLGEIVADAVWPAIVDGDTWEGVNSILRQPGRRSVNLGGRRLLSGLARCGVCGATVHAGGAARAGVANYRCSGSFGHFARMAEPVDEYVSAVTVARLSRPDAAELLVARDAPDFDQLRSETLAVRGRLDALAVDFADGALTSSQLRAATERLRTRLRELEAAMADSARTDALAPLIAAADVHSAWSDLSTSRQRAVVEILMDVSIHPPGRGTRTFNPDTVGIEWKN